MTKLFVDANASCKVGNLMDTCPDGKNSGLVKELGSSNKYIRGEQDIIYSSVNKSPLFDYDEESYEDYLCPMYVAPESIVSYYTNKKRIQEGKEIEMNTTKSIEDKKKEDIYCCGISFFNIICKYYPYEF